VAIFNHRAELGFVEFVIEVGKGFPGIWIVLEELGWRYWGRSGKAPGYENWLAFGSVVGQISLPEHKNAGGKTTSGT
jgi:hypothetical protein